ncbi:MAG: X-linked retinitis pigmentosa GTPase regulator isoform X1 [Harvfovirus sp.]|uniref:X-linked retinitis pigmentosa GTPase regulator isoform X1 n=1 Tax=Harvfovirus sp. TaxID=2487768 RepID=A0A3G5A2A3_9VIRU|nr:MAG: X-linked retinitis pigmentosa GTPase regulator isoform X1 [Harvfovirus sp.]
MRVYFNKCGRSRLIQGGGLQSIVTLSDGTLIPYGQYDDERLISNVSTNVLNQINQIENIMEIAHGSHVVLRLRNGTLMSSGFNSHGELGLGDEKERQTFTEIPGIKNVKKVVCCLFHTVILLTDGRLMVCGKNDFGQLGTGDNVSRNIFTEITLLPNAVADVVCGELHTYIVLTDGTLMSTGWNNNGQLGLGNETTVNNFTEIKGIAKNIAKISCGGDHTIIRFTNGKLMGCGLNRSGQLALGDCRNRNIFTEIKFKEKVVDVICGMLHTFVLLTDGRLMSCGSNGYGALGLDENEYGRKFELTYVPIVERNIAELVCGDNHTLIRLTDGTLKGCGLNKCSSEYSPWKRNYSFSVIKKYSINRTMFRKFLDI